MKTLLSTLLIYMLALNVHAQNPSLLKDINPNGNSNFYQYNFTPFLDKTVFQAHDSLTNGLWITDGTTAELNLFSF
ncbi:MAG: hypothetical protein IPM91_22530 [Bacteroidetes bacterium]|nr:hypothetical protein [Bacteroidota bacterium]